jgi:hypothetical protein
MGHPINVPFFILIDWMQGLDEEERLNAVQSQVRLDQGLDKDGNSPAIH